MLNCISPVLPGCRAVPSVFEFPHDGKDRAVVGRKQVAVGLHERLAYGQILRTVLFTFAAFYALGSKGRLLAKPHGLYVFMPGASFILNQAALPVAEVTGHIIVVAYDQAADTGIFCLEIFIGEFTGT